MDRIHEIIKEERNKNFAASAQLSLGEIIKKIEKCGLTYGNDNEPKEVYYDFGSAIPTNLDSWRGSYSELALGYALSGYDNRDSHFNKITAHELLNDLKSAIGKTFVGWKGGDFIMDENTPVWVANRGNSGNTGIVDVVDDVWRIIIMTAYCTY